MNTIADPLAKVTARIQQAALAVSRSPDGVRLIAVSKTQPATAIKQAYVCGQRDFGENYVQEALEKQAELVGTSDVIWHFIGPIQSNKTRAIAENFAWIHSIDREKIAQRLNAQRPSDLPPLQVCLQVNIDDENTKSGVSLTEVSALAKAVSAMPRLQLRGLMAIPAAGNTAEQQHVAFAKLRNALIGLQAQGYAVDTLSMGMSGDLEAAIAEGATMVRVGTDIFGARVQTE
ncbi:MAG: YggS family pyridoxal phosphate-dependent enzyme [Gammaproteobacteria bacterium]|nr:MAG: YggS family pyridoxal phosphate-dependent enzyme [Gammaproteobacteria bacterium]